MAQIFDIELRNSWVYARDLGTHLLIGALLFGMSRSLQRFMVTATAIFTTLTFGNAMKLAILGAPVAPDDFVAARNMFLLLDGWQLATAIALVTVPLALLVWSIDWRRGWSWANVGLLGAGVAAVMLAPAPITRALDANLGNSVWNQPGNFAARGLPLHLLQETARNLSRRVAPPTQVEVTEAFAVVEDGTKSDFVKVSSQSDTRRRNVHMIVLESFWDPTLLTASKLSADPFDPAFRALWRAGGESHLLSPVFGGYTANTEFEVLCGFPVTEDNVFFETGLKRSAPCLPTHLVEAGYHTLASHPNAASFWNRVNAYQRIGIQTYWSDRDFLRDDMNRNFLSDASLYRQVLEKIGPELRDNRPLFDYVLTYFGHLDYPLNERRPKAIHAAPGHETVEAYANTVYYKSRELMAFLKELRQQDPDGVIVLFGDHLPALGPNFGGYTESGVLKSQRGDFDDSMMRTLVRTPLVVIDGQRGPVKLGDVPAFQIPALLLELLGDRRPSIMDLANRDPEKAPIRPLPGLNVTLADTETKVCRDGESKDPACERSAHWVEAIKTLRTDIFSGEQHTLKDLDPPGGRFREASVGTAAQHSDQL
ncbi:sulfatase [Thiorhodococcus drewsii AZ1]|uniref:Sulfatase n=1 Tax=Thiorhodococcus drewsii AZ1 TaxID=765913 RepID=G2E5L3_9GAMM|nr:LTA synthase family protein [Thiorhodococcus drewsii]EGV28682.1 sulfatase [Thiorhodococcus drewsii AZ1]